MPAPVGRASKVELRVHSPSNSALPPPPPPFPQLQAQISQLQTELKAKVAACQLEADAARRTREELTTVSRKCVAVGKEEEEKVQSVRKLKRNRWKAIDVA